MEREDGGRRRDVALDAYRGGRRASCGRMDAEICEREREGANERGAEKEELGPSGGIDTETVLERESERENW